MSHNEAGVPRIPRGDLVCRFGCDMPAEALYHVPKGCICWTDPVQVLCKQHENTVTSEGPVDMIAKLTPEIEWRKT